MIEYQTGTPTEVGMYACRIPVPKTVGIYEDKFLMWIDKRWSYPGSDQNFRGDVPYFVGPLRRRMPT